MSELAQKVCIPCQGGIPPIKGEKLKEWMEKLGNDWEVVDEHHLVKNLTYPDFVTPLAVVNKIGELAEAEGHHPDIYFTWGKLRFELFTHKIDGLSESDFVFAAKIDCVLSEN